MPFSLKGTLSLDGKAFKSGVDKAKRAVSGLGEKMDRASRKMRVGMWRAKKSIGKMPAALGKLTGSLKAVAGPLAVLGGAIAGGLALVGHQVKASMDWAANITKLGRAFGVTTSDVQRFEYAASQTGATTDEVMDAIKDLGKNASEALDFDSANKIWAFRQFGLEVEDLRGKKPAELFRMVSAAVNDMENTKTPAFFKAIEELMGGAGIKTLPMMKAGLEDLMAAADAAGTVASDAAVVRLNEAAEKLDQAMSRWKKWRTEKSADIVDFIDDQSMGADRTEAVNQEMLSKMYLGTASLGEIMSGLLGGAGIGGIAQITGWGDRGRLLELEEEKQFIAAREKKAAKEEADEKREKAEAEQEQNAINAKKKADADKAKKAAAVVAEKEKVEAEAVEAKRMTAWTGFGPDKLEKIGGSMGMRTTQLNISQQQLALMIEAQRKREELSKNLAELKNVIIH